MLFVIYIVPPYAAAAHRIHSVFVVDLAENWQLISTISIAVHTLKPFQQEFNGEAVMMKPRPCLLGVLEVNAWRITKIHKRSIHKMGQSRTTFHHQAILRLTLTTLSFRV